MKKILKGLALITIGLFTLRAATAISNMFIFMLATYVIFIGFGFITQLFIATKKVLYTSILMLLIALIDMLLSSSGWNDYLTIITISISVTLTAAGAFVGSKILKNKNQETPAMSGQQMLATPEMAASHQWPYQAILGFSFFFGTGAGFLLTWKSLEKLGDKESSRKFLVWGGVTFVLLQVVAVFIISKNASLGRSLNMLGIVFPMWYLEALKKWKLQHTENTKFEWAMVLWAVAGMFVTFAINILVIYFLGLA